MVKVSNAMKTSGYIFLFLWLCGMGYTQNVPHALTRITVNCKDISKEIELSSIFKIDYIPLETNERCVIQRIEKVVTSEDHWIVWDKPTNSVFSFNKAGKFINKISASEDRGPGKFKYCYDIDAANDRLYLLAGKMILIFDLDLHYLNRLPMTKVYSKFMIKAGWAYLYSNTQTATDREKVGALSLAHPDSVFPLLNENRDLGFFTMVEPLNFSYHAGEVLFSYMLTDTIYALNQATVYPKHLLDFPGKEFAKHAFDQLPKDPYEIGSFVNALDKTAYIHLINRYIENDLGVTFSFKMGNQKAIYFQSSTNKTHFLTDNFLLEGLPFDLVFVGSTSNSMITTVNSLNLTPNRKEALKSRGYTVGNSSTPTLLVFSAL